MTKEDIPEIVRRMNEVGLTSMQTGLDNHRNTVGNPLAGIDPEEIIDTFPICKEIDRYILNDGKVRAQKKILEALPRDYVVIDAAPLLTFRVP
jgi:sulfite reductase beta subunit-like hemoprotein